MSRHLYRACVAKVAGRDIPTHELELKSITCDEDANEVSHPNEVEAEVNKLQQLGLLENMQNLRLIYHSRKVTKELPVYHGTTLGTSLSHKKH